MRSDNPFGADDQQETRDQDSDLDPWWVVGFVDGEGCFSVTVHRNPLVRRTPGWQLQAAFQAYQHEDAEGILHALRSFFGCGAVRAKGPNSRVMTYSVWSLQELDTKVIPFFEQHPLLIKRRDFERFSEIVRSMRRKEHLSADGFERLVRLSYEMNANGKQRRRTLEEVLMGSSETARQAPVKPGEGTVRSSWRHEESGRNDLTALDGHPFGVVTRMPKVAKFLVG